MPGMGGKESRFALVEMKGDWFSARVFFCVWGGGSSLPISDSLKAQAWADGLLRMPTPAHALQTRDVRE